MDLVSYEYRPLSYFIHRLTKFIKKDKEDKMNKGKLLQISPLNDEQIYICIHSYKMVSTPYHCVLILIGCRIDLLLFVPTNKIVSLLLKVIEKNQTNQTNINSFPKIIH